MLFTILYVCSVWQFFTKAVRQHSPIQRRDDVVLPYLLLAHYITAGQLCCQPFSFVTDYCSIYQFEICARASQSQLGSIFTEQPDNPITFMNL